MITCYTSVDVCWICNSSADLSAEHKIKKTDLERYPLPSPSIVFSESKKKKPIQGLNSKLLKFNKSICRSCNSERTQKSDRAYDHFMSENANIINLKGQEGQVHSELCDAVFIELSHRTDLARYFGKHLGCALRYQDFPIPIRLSDFVGDRSNKQCIAVSMRFSPYFWRDDDGTNYHLHALGGAYIKPTRNNETLSFSYQSAFMTGGIQFTVSMGLEYLEASEISIFVTNSTKFSFRHFSEEEGKYRGL